MTGSGWMTARKSSSQVARDKARAEESRRRRKGLAPKKEAKKKAKSRFDDDDDDDDGDSLDSFVVDDNDVDEGDWSEGDEEEDALEDIEEDESNDDRVARPTKTKKKNKKAKAALDDESSSSDDDDFPLFSEPSKRKSKPSPHMLRQAKLAATSKKPTSKPKKVVDLLSSPEEKPRQSRKRIQKRTAAGRDDGDTKQPESKKANTGRKSVVSLSSDEDEDEDMLLADPFAKRPAVASKTPQSAILTGPASGKTASKSSTQVSELPRAAVSRFFSSAKEPSALDDDHNDEEEPTPVVSRRSKKASRVFEDNDEEMSPPKRKTQQVMKSDDEEGYDEDIALALAISESEAQASATKKPSENQFSKFAASRTESKSVLEDLKDSDEEKEPDDEPEDEDDNYGDDELDEDAKEARSILETAQRLSQQVLQHLKSWSGEEASTTGMIVQDGAIALTMGDPTIDKEVSEKWISQELLKKVCPSVELAPYQQIGVNWLALLHNMTVDVDGKPTTVNGVLADEMGLGKTCQTIVFLSWLKYQQEHQKGGARTGDGNRPIGLDSDDDASIEDVSEVDSDSMPNLVVVPASVLQNWKIEFEKFAPHLNVVKYHGSMNEREDIKEYLRQFLSTKKRRPGDSLDVILAPLTYFQKEKSDDRSFLRKFRFNYLVCDEAHLLKNFRGQRYKTLDRFRTKHRLLLSGTPVMNNPQELMSLLCFLMPLFSRKSQGFASDEDNNDGGSRMLQHFVSLDKEGADDAAAYRKLKELFAPFVLRRRKLDVLSQIMPPKERKVQFVELDTVGRQIYNGVLERHLKKKGQASREHLFTQLRKAAHHPLLLRTRYLEDSEKNHLVDCFYKYGAFRGEGCTREKVREELEGFNDFDIHLTALELLEANPLRESDLQRYVLEKEDLFSSAKCTHLRKLLPELVSKGHRILIFSVWTNCLDLLSCLLEQLDMKYLRMEGSTPVPERQSLIDEFSKDESIPIFLLSTKACGLGINLVSADTCIMHDIDFNPFNDLQAEDRCHRIGQKKPVTVYKLVAKDTVDEDIYSMQERKARMSAAIMEASSSDFEAKQERENVLKTAVDRFLGSPNGRKSSKKKNTPDDVTDSI